MLFRAINTCYQNTTIDLTYIRMTKLSLEKPTTFLRSDRYFPHIDGLRAFSIIAVILYHIDFDPFNSGYMGVDIFFVISGFLIINHIRNKLASKNFSFQDFWARRALRILPPYFLVILSCIIIAPYVLFTEIEQQSFAKEVLYSSLMIPNHLFLSLQGYFDTSSESKPLLHLWSLGVEEQFYIVTPLLLVALVKLPSKAQFGCLFTLFLTSLILCIFYTVQAGDKNYAFFLMPLRAWEFLAGASIAFILPYLKQAPKRLLQYLPLTSLMVLLTAVTAFSSESTFPGTIATIPVLAACLFIISGFTTPESRIIRFFSSKQITYLGLVSYAWYLWHWPLIVLIKKYNLGELTDIQKYSLFFLSLALAIFTHHLIEKPILNWRQKSPQILNGKTVLISIIICFSIGIIGYTFLPQKLPQQEITLKRTYDDQALFSACKINNKNNIACMPDLETSHQGLLIGDSHAISSVSSLTNFARNQNSKLYSLASGGCISLPFLNVHIPYAKMRERCSSYRKNLNTHFSTKKLTPEYAILLSRWNIYLDTSHKNKFKTHTKSGTLIDTDTVTTTFLQAFEETATYLKENGVKRILIIAPLPEFSLPAPECIIRALHLNRSPKKDCGIPRTDTDKERELSISLLEKAAAKDEAIRLIDPINLFCDDKICLPFSQNKIFFRDTNHPSDLGIEKIIKFHQTEFDWLLGTQKNSVDFPRLP